MIQPRESEKMMKEYDSSYTLQEKIEQDGILIVQFGSASCQPCAALWQRISLWQEAHGDVEALYVSIERYPQLAAQNGIFTVPAVLVYVKGRLTLRESGCFSLELLLRQAERYRAFLA